MADLSPEAVDRAQRSIAAAPIFAQNAEVIAAQTPDLPTDDVLVAVVDTAYTFTGTWIVSRAQMVERVPELEGDGWAMVFSHKSDADQVRHRANEMGSLAAKRIEMIARVRSKEAFRTAGSVAVESETTPSEDLESDDALTADDGNPS